MLSNLLRDSATQIVAFAGVAGNRGRNTPGVDGPTAIDVEQGLGPAEFLDRVHVSFRPLPVRQCMIPKPGGPGSSACCGFREALGDRKCHFVD